jgi:NTE family protein
MAAGPLGEGKGVGVKDAYGVPVLLSDRSANRLSEELHERLKSFALLENVGDAALRNLLAEANWFALPGGTLLDRDGENNAALFLVVTGSLGVFVLDPQGQRQMVAHIPAGETVGEMSLIAGSSNHAAQLVALRDTELLRISPDGFEALIARHPRVMMNLMQMLVKRLKDANRGRSPKSQPKNLCHRAAA